MELTTKPRFFKSPGELRKWFEKNYDSVTELWVGYYKKGSGKPSITWPESVDQALCFGWIDGIRKSLDEKSYVIRFTPRRKGSIWSAINIKRVEELSDQGLMRESGTDAFAKRKEYKSRVYAYEQEGDQLVEPYATKLKRNRKAWKFFQSQSPSYRKLASWWIVSAKKEETRLRRLGKLIDDSAHERSFSQMLGTKAAK